MEELFASMGLDPPDPGKQFESCAFYLEHLDWLNFLTEDVSFRAHRIDPFLTVFLHPYEERIVGFRICGFLELFKSLRQYGHVEEDGSLPLRQLVRWTLEDPANQPPTLETFALLHRKTYYDAAEDIAADHAVSPERLPSLAA